MPFRPDESTAMFSIMSFNEPSFDPAVRSHASGDLAIDPKLLLAEIEEEKKQHRAIHLEDFSPPPLAYLSSPESSPDGPIFPRRVVRAPEKESMKDSPNTTSSKSSRSRREDLYKRQSSRRRVNSSPQMESAADEGGGGISSSGGRRKSLNHSSSSSSPHHHRSSRRPSAPNRDSEPGLTNPGRTNNDGSSGNRRPSASGGTSKRNLQVPSGLPGVYSSSNKSPSRRRLSASAGIPNTKEEEDEDHDAEGQFSPRRTSRNRDNSQQGAAPTLTRTSRATSRRNLLTAMAPPPPPAPADFRTPSPQTQNAHRKSLTRSASDDVDLLKSAGSSGSSPAVTTPVRRSLLVGSSKDTPPNQGSSGRKGVVRSASDGAAASTRPAPSRRHLLQQAQTSQSPSMPSGRRQSGSNRSPSHSRRSRMLSSRTLGGGGGDGEQHHQVRRRSQSAERKSEHRSRSSDRKNSNGRGAGTSRSRSKSRDRRTTGTSIDDGAGCRRGCRTTSPKDRKARTCSKSREASGRRHGIRNGGRAKRDSGGGHDKMDNPDDPLVQLFMAKATGVAVGRKENETPEEGARNRAVRIEESGDLVSPRLSTGNGCPSPNARYVQSQQACKDKKEESKARRSSIMKSLKDVLMSGSDQDNFKLEVQKDGTKRLVVDLSDLHSVMEEFGMRR